MLTDAIKPTNESLYQPQNHAMKDPQVTLDEMKAQIRALEAQLALAKGTQDQVGVTAAPTPKVELLKRIELLLRSRPYSTDELAKAVGEPLMRVQEKLKALRQNLADVGTPAQARWVWKVGDDTSAKDLRDLVARLIEGHAMTTAELAQITGARMPRVNGVLVDLQRTPGVPIYNLGSAFRAQWLILPKTARPANLPPKSVKR